MEADEHQPRMKALQLSEGMLDVVHRLATGAKVADFERAMLREELGIEENIG